MVHLLADGRVAPEFIQEMNCMLISGSREFAMATANMVLSTAFSTWWSWDSMDGRHVWKCFSGGQCACQIKLATKRDG